MLRIQTLSSVYQHLQEADAARMSRCCVCSAIPTSRIGQTVEVAVREETESADNGE